MSVMFSLFYNMFSCVDDIFLLDFLFLFFFYVIYVLFGRLLIVDSLIDFGLMLFSGIMVLENLVFIVDEVSLFFG